MAHKAAANGCASEDKDSVCVWQRACKPAAGGDHEHDAKGFESARSTPAKTLATALRRSTMDSPQCGSKSQKAACQTPAQYACSRMSRQTNDKLKEQLDNVLQNLISEIDTFDVASASPQATVAEGRRRQSLDVSPTPTSAPVPALATPDDAHLHPLSQLRVDELAALRQAGYVDLAKLLETYCPAFKLQSSSWLFLKLVRRLRPANVDARNDASTSANSRSVGSKRLFGVPLDVLQTTSRSPLPPCIIELMRFLQTNEQENLGIFRKAGNRKKIADLRRLIESVEVEELRQVLTDLLDLKLLKNQPHFGYADKRFTPFDVADCMKQFFRELPECIFTNKLSDALIALYEHAPVAQRKDALRNVVYLLPDSNREALKLLLAFLHNLAQSAKTHQMTTSNLAVCFSPSLFFFPKAFTPVVNNDSGENRARRATGIPDMKELLRQKAAQQCLADMITDWQKLFCVGETDLRSYLSLKHTRRKNANGRHHSSGSPESRNKRHSGARSSAVSDMSEFEEEYDRPSRTVAEPASLDKDLWTTAQVEVPLRYRSYTDTGNYTMIVDGFLSTMMKEYRHQYARRRRGWIAVPIPHTYLIGKAPLSGLAYKRMADGHPLSLWRCSIDISASPNRIFRRLILEEPYWNDCTLISNEVLEIVDVNVDIVHRLERDPYVLEPISMTPTINDRCILRSWRHDLANSRNVKAIVCTSINHPCAPASDSYVSRVHVFEHGYVIEPITERKTRVTLFSREDIRGKSTEWYQRFWPTHCCCQLEKLHKSFESIDPSNETLAEAEATDKHQTQTHTKLASPVSAAAATQDCAMCCETAAKGSSSPDPNRETFL